ncbi:MAG: peptidylprolyl isomerase [Verrucomicrobiota bacterium]
MIPSKIQRAALAGVLATGLLALPGCKPPAPAESPSKPESTPATEQASTPESTPAPASEATPAETSQPAAEAVTEPVSIDTAVTDAEAPKPAEGAATPAESASKPIELPEVVAIVNGKEIKRGELEEIFKAAVQSSGMNPADLSPQQQLGGYTQLLNDLIERQLLLDASAAVKVTDADVDAEIKKFKSQFPDEAVFEAQMKQAGMNQEKLRKDVREELQIRGYMQSKIKAPEVTPEQAKSFYESNQKEFERPQTVKASHILFMVDPDAPADVVKQKEEAAKKAAARAKKGEDFTTLAKELSEEPGAKESGGDLGFFPKDRMVPEFANAAFEQKIDEIGEPVKTQFGWHVIKVTDKKDAGTVPYDEVKDQISAYLKSTGQREAAQTVMKNLKDSAKIETFLPSAS